MRTGVATKFYMPKLSEEDLGQAVECLRLSYDRAPKFASWLLDAVLDEQQRRLLSRDGTPRETSLLTLPAAEWTARELVQGLMVVNAMSYGVHNESLGRLVDRLVNVFTASVGARFIIAEDYIHAIENIASQNG